MWMTRALRFSAVVELPDLPFELLLLAREIPLVGDHQLFIGGDILPKRSFICEDGLEKRTDQPPNENSRRIQPSRGHVHGSRTMCHHLCHVHLSPLPHGRGLQIVYARDHLVNGILLKQVLHGLPSQVVCPGTSILPLETVTILHLTHLFRLIRSSCWLGRRWPR